MLKDAPCRLRPAIQADAESARDVVFAALAEYGLKPDACGADADLSNLGSFYAAPDDWFAVLVDPSDRVRGTVGLKRVDADTVELRKMYLDRSCRGQGWGRHLLDSALRQARSMGFRRVILETATVLCDAIALYDRTGFRRLPGQPHVCRCDLVMELRLDASREEARTGACVGGADGASSPACDRPSARLSGSSSSPPCCPGA